MPGGIIVTASIDQNTALPAIRAIEAAISSASLENWLHDDANKYVTARAKQRFTTEGDDVVGKWQQLKPATVAIREAAGYGGAHPINHRTGALEAYIVNSDGATTATATGAELVTPSESASGELGLKLAMAQSGGSSKWGNPIPKRPVIGINMQDGLVLTQMLEIFIEGKIATGGLL